MFCPNCGTKNESTAEKCAQCGFDLQTKKPAPKFKGTVMMQQTPLAQQGGASAQQGGASAQQGGASAQRGGASDKDDPARGATDPGAQASPTAASPTRASQKVAQPTGPSKGTGPTKLKGTMMGVAPPGMRDEIEKARQAAEAKKQSASARTGADPSAPPARATPAVGAAGTASPGSAKATAGAGSSKLKGTMIGVAPPEMKGAIAAAQAKISGGEQSSGKQEPPGAGAPEDRDPPSDPVNPLGGTVVGTSPFHRPEMRATDPAPASPAAAHGEQMPSAAAPATAATGAGAAPQAPPESFGEPSGTVEMTAAPEQRPHTRDHEAHDAFAQTAPEAPPGAGPIGSGLTDEPFDRSIDSIPGRKKSALPLVLLVVAFVVAGGLLVLALMGGADGADDTAEDLVEDVAQPAEGDPAEE